MNPLDWTGPNFLAFFTILLAASIVLAELAWHALHLPSGDLDPADAKRHPLELVYLSAGAEGTAQAAIVALTQKGHLAWDSAADQLTACSRPIGPVQLEHDIWEQLRHAGSVGVDARTLATDVAPRTAGIAARLEEDGLLVGEFQAVVIRLAMLCILLPAVVLGGMKLRIGFSLDRPILFLVALEIAAVVVLLIYLFREIHRSRKGAALLDALRSRSSGLSATLHSASGGLTSTDLLLGVALFGVASLKTGPWKSLHAAFLPKASGGTACGGGWSGSSCGSSCGGSSCGSSCGGGCGGGGCGGCGG